MKKKMKAVVFVVVLYCLTCLTVAALASLISVSSFFRSQFGVSKTSSIIARGALLPYIQLSKKINGSFFLAWEKGLLIVEETPNFIAQAQKLQKTYTDHLPLDPQLIFSTQMEYSKLLNDSIILQQLISESKFAQILLPLTSYDIIQNQLAQNAQLFQAIDTLLDYISNRLAENKPISLLFLFQNNMELRPTGGFPGSYATLRLAKNEPITFEVQDIYVPDGQLKGHVDPPLPIQEAFQQGFWKLRDANWHPDFQESATRINWFFTEAGHADIDGIVAINFTTIQKLLEITGPVKVSDLNTTVTTENIYQILQRADDKDFFAGSTKKRDTLSAFTTQLIFELQHLPPKKYFSIISLLTTQLKQKDILINIDDPDLSTLITLNHWDGKLTPVSCTDDGCIQDYFSVFEANLGVNKSNCCVNRNITLVKERDQQGQLTTTSTLQYHNLGPGTKFAGVAGDYRAFIRIYFPANTQLSTLEINDKSYEQFIAEMKTAKYFHPITSDNFSWGDVAGLKELGMWIEVPQEKELTVVIKTTNVLSHTLPYSIIIQKQSGSSDQFNQYKVSLDDHMLFSGTIATDELFQQ
ncbi:MAG: DUF4012 domain-containing protein [Patescibacteria group bacterium]